MARIWMAVDALFLDDPEVAELGEQTGPAGPLLLIYLMGQAKIQNGGGEAKIAFRRAQHAACLKDRDEARTILRVAKQLGLLESVEFEDLGFEIQFPPEVWEKWQRARRNQDYQAGLRRGKTGKDEGALQDNTEQNRTKKKTPPSGGQKKKAAAKPKPDAIPGDCPPGARPFVEPVRAVLLRIAEGKPGCVTPSLAGVAKALKDFPDKDWLAEANDHEHWLLHGTGQGNTVKDVLRSYRNQLNRAPDVNAKTPPNGRAPDRAVAPPIKTPRHREGP